MANKTKQQPQPVKRQWKNPRRSTASYVIGIGVGMIIADIIAVEGDFPQPVFLIGLAIMIIGYYLEYREAKKANNG